jgi:hypothetical protein
MDRYTIPVSTSSEVQMIRAYPQSMLPDGFKYPESFLAL